MDLPKYQDLPVRSGLPPRSAWGLWGDDDQLGTLNLLTEDRALRASRLVRTGKTFPLGLPMDEPRPALFGRKDLRRRTYRIQPNILDDSIDDLFPQSSSQWDALCHVGHPQYGFWNGASRQDVTSETDQRNGVEHYARKGIVGRGVLLDVERHWQESGRSIDGAAAVEITPQDLDEVRQAQGVDFEVGDILLLRTGWVAWYERSSDETKQQLARDGSRLLRSPGLIGTEVMAEWLWDNHFAAVAADNPGLEACPHAFEVDQYLHFRLLPLLGMAVGEMWYLEKLAGSCAEDGVYDFLLTAAPFNITGGVGSPANALAIK